ncbi:MAG: phosphonate C-P lyase system protein PhnH [Oscillospiraceae bacterium]|nr:phosphonate C-P lyase system protein PhnH [Oscillospiraceae bacterium]
MSNCENSTAMIDDSPMEYDSSLSAQSIFRETMNAFAHPLRIYNIKEAASKNPLTQGQNAILMELSGIFLDNCVGFYVHDNVQLSAQLKELTYAIPCAIEIADFVIMENPNEFDRWEEISQGTLVDPHLGATVIIRIPQIVGDVAITAQGPGINGQESFLISHDVAKCIFSVRQLEIEYPKGIDLLFASQQGDICALGRHVAVITNA